MENVVNEIKEKRVPKETKIIEGKKYILNVYITEKEEVLQKFLLDHDSVIFHEMKALEKVDLSKMK